MRLIFTTTAILALLLLASFSGKKSLVVTSYAFKENDYIPVKYSCLGQSASPPLTISNIPPTALSLAIIVDDPDVMLGLPPRVHKKVTTKKGKKVVRLESACADSCFVNWVIWNIDTGSVFPENFKNDNEGLNSMKERGYRGICPTSGTHHFHFKVYALDVKLNLNKNSSKADVEKAIQGHIVGWGELVGIFDKNYHK